MMPAVAQESLHPDGWQAALRLGFRVGGARTVLAERQRRGPLAVQRPFYPEGGICHVYLLHPPGGVVGGDVLDIDVGLDHAASAVVTTPGATKFYRSAGSTACQIQHLRLAPDATLEWLPQENIFFPGAQVRLQTHIALQTGARLAYWEIQCLGRPAIDESFDSGNIDSRLMLSRDGGLLINDRLRVDPASRTRLSLLAGRAVTGTLMIGPADDAAVTACRELLPAEGHGHVGATLVEDILVVRYLGDSTAQARRLFTEIWQALRVETMGHQPCVPRIWAT